MPQEKLIIFVKAPRPGAVKTRLAQAVGPEAACRAYEALARATFAQLERLPEIEVRFTPDDALAEVQPWLRRTWKARPQGAGNLGQRLHRAFADAIFDGAVRVVAIGSDCPGVTERDVREAWRALRSHDVVIGPASDGGYWLIGLNRPQPSVFVDIQWSTDRVLPQTLERAAANRLRVRLLHELTDVDTEAQWRCWIASRENRARTGTRLTSE